MVITLFINCNFTESLLKTFVDGYKAILSQWMNDLFEKDFLDFF